MCVCVELQKFMCVVSVSIIYIIFVKYDCVCCVSFLFVICILQTGRYMTHSFIRGSRDFTKRVEIIAKYRSLYVYVHVFRLIVMRSEDVLFVRKMAQKGSEACYSKCTRLVMYGVRYHHGRFVLYVCLLLHTSPETKRNTVYV